MDYYTVLTYQPRTDGRLSWPSWLTDSRQFTNRVVGHLSTIDWAQIRGKSIINESARTCKVNKADLSVAHLQGSWPLDVGTESVLEFCWPTVIVKHPGC